MKKVKLHPADESKLPDIPELKFFCADVDLYYFNAGEFLKKSKSRPGTSIPDFLNSFQFLIQALRETNNLEEADLYVSDITGNEYLEECLTLPFLAYVERSFGPYLFERMEELLRYGFSVNDPMIKFLYQTRFDQ